ncbi:MAG: DEAD/DEAH box helicase, partial [Candidatus Phosphoribacter baldrii]
MTSDVLTRFSPATADWFRGSFVAPTPAQEGAWGAISSGHHALVVAPTGSGKTLAAFLWALDRLAVAPVPEDRTRRCRVLYVSPLKALAVDVERNLRSPLVGIGHAAARLGMPLPQVRVAVRSGDTPAADRRGFVRDPADILITTPESLFLMLTSAARESLAGVETVILDEVHAVAGTKRGAHLAVTLERLDALLERPAQRIGLSATVRPIEEVARFLAGGRPVDIVAPPSTKEWDLQVVVPVPDLGELGAPTGDLSGPAAAEPARASIWPHVEERIVDLVAAHRSTLVFANSRRLAERLTSRLNEIWEERLDEAADPAVESETATARGPDSGAGTGAHGIRAGGRGNGVPGGMPAQVMAQAGATRGAPALLARAHH